MQGQISIFDLIEQKPSIRSDKPCKSTICLAEVPESEYKQDNGVEIPTLQEIIKLLNNAPLKYGNAEVISDLFTLGALSISSQFDMRKCVYNRREDEKKK